MMYAESMLPKLEALARRATEAERLQLAWLEFKRKSGSWVLRVFIERDEERIEAEGEVGLQDCERVGQRLGLLLDVEDPIDSSYTLEVSTPGLDRPLREPRDYQRFAGRLARLQTREPLHGRRRFRGRLGGVVSGSVLLFESDAPKETGEPEKFTIPLTAIESGRLEVELGQGERPSGKARKH